LSEVRDFVMNTGLSVSEFSTSTYT
jgi:hypothetical protein